MGTDQWSLVGHLDRDCTSTCRRWHWRCANIALATQTQDIELLSKSIDQFWGEDGSEWWFSYGKLVEEVLVIQTDFPMPQTIAPPELESKLHLLEATAHTGRLNISDAQNAIKKVPLDAPETTDNERILAYHLRVLTRELAGSTKGMEKYIALGLPYNKAIFSIHMGRSKLYQQAKTTAIQNFSALNGYPIPPKLQQEYTDMLMLSKRLNGSASKITIGSHALEYDFMDNDAEFREWLVTYQSEVMDAPTGCTHDHPTASILARRKQTCRSTYPDTPRIQYPSIVSHDVYSSTIFGCLHQGRKGTDIYNVETIAKTRAWMDEVPFPQMLRTHPEWFKNAWLQ